MTISGMSGRHEGRPWAVCGHLKACPWGYCYRYRTHGAALYRLGHVTHVADSAIEVSLWMGWNEVPSARQGPTRLPGYNEHNATVRDTAAADEGAGAV